MAAGHPLPAIDAPARRGRRRLAGAVAASLLLHFLLLSLGQSTPGQPGAKLPAPVTLQLRLAESRTIARLPSPTATPPLPSAEPLPAASSGNHAPPPVFNPDNYLPLPALDLKPLVQREPIALLPANADPHQHGRITLEIFLSASGQIDRIAVIDVTPTGLPPSWLAAAISGFRGATYSPGWKDGQAVPSRFRIEIEHQQSPD